MRLVFLYPVQQNRNGEGTAAGVRISGAQARLGAGWI